MMVHACNFSAWEVEDQELNPHLCTQFRASPGYLPDDPVFKIKTRSLFVMGSGCGVQAPLFPCPYLHSKQIVYSK